MPKFKIVDIPGVAAPSGKFTIRSMPSGEQDDSEYQDILSEVRARRASGPQVPISTEYGAMTEEDEAQSILRQRRQKAAEQERYEARTPGQRAKETGAFTLSAPVRMATRGEYGAGDVAGLLGFPETAEDLKRKEAGFAWANKAGLETAAHAGEIAMGVPGLSTMGAVPGQVMRSAAMTARQPLRSMAEIPESYGFNKANIARVLREDVGSGPIGRRVMNVRRGSARPDVNPDLSQASKASIIAAGERIAQSIPDEKFVLPKYAVAGDMTERVAGGLTAIPYSGTPIVKSYEKGLFGLGRAAETATERMGFAGREGAGQSVKMRLEDWMKNKTGPMGDDISALYDKVDKLVKPTQSVNPQNLKNAVKRMRAKSVSSKAASHGSVIRLVEDAIDPKKYPKGIPYKDLKELRTAIRARMTGDVTPEAGTSQQALEWVRKALTDDIKFAVQRTGGKKALTAFEEANTAAQNAAQIKGIFDKIIGRDASASPQRVIARIEELAKGRGNLASLRRLRQVMPKDEWGDVAASVAARFGRDLSTGEFSPARFLTDYGKLAPNAKTILFGEAKQALDDIALTSYRFKRVSGRFNLSNTGTVNALMKLLMNPVTTIGGAGAAATGLINPATALTAAGTMVGLRTGRSVAWALSEPAVTKEAAKVFKAYYRASTRLGPAEAIAKREAELAGAIRSYAAAVAQKTGGRADDVESAIKSVISKTQKGNYIPENIQ